MLSDDDIRALREALSAGPTPIAMELYGDRYFSGDYARADASKAQHDYIAAASPDRIARLLDEVARLRVDAERLRAADERRKRRSVTYVCPQCAASMIRDGEKEERK